MFTREEFKKEFDRMVWELSVVIYPAALAVALMIWSIALFE